MIRYNIQLERPKYIHHPKLYSLKSRGTYYGIHRDMVLTNYDPKCSKSSLLMFVEKSHAITFRLFLEQQQKNNLMMDRILDTNYTNNTIRSTSLQPLLIEQLTSNQLEILCLLNFFNSVIVNKVQKEQEGIVVCGYEFITYDVPNRQIIEYNLYKSFNNHT